jgi:integrase
VRGTWVTAAKRIFGWAKEQNHIPRNPFGEVKVTVVQLIRTRETLAFEPHEYGIILRASIAVKDTRTPKMAARRWAPWLLAYSGARPHEITQLRKMDVIKLEGTHGIRITPEAGTVKNKQVRTVPLHEHLIEQGFLEFVAGCGDGPMFFKGETKASHRAPTKQKKARASQVCQRLAAWARDLGVRDPKLRPNHAWRHTFKQVADRAGITERMSNYITGHAEANVGATYGAPTLSGKAEALAKFPRYEF